MASFNIPTSQIRSLMNKYLKASKLFPKERAQEIMFLLSISEKKDKDLQGKKLLVEDELFYESLTIKREKSSTLFYGLYGK